MRGRISDKLERVLEDSDARTLLRERLISGKGGPVKVGQKTFNLKTEVSKKPK